MPDIPIIFDPSRDAGGVTFDNDSSNYAGFVMPTFPFSGFDNVNVPQFLEPVVEFFELGIETISDWISNVYSAVASQVSDQYDIIRQQMLDSNNVIGTMMHDIKDSMSITTLMTRLLVVLNSMEVEVTE